MQGLNQKVLVKKKESKDGGNVGVYDHAYRGALEYIYVLGMEESMGVLDAYPAP